MSRMQQPLRRATVFVERGYVAGPTTIIDQSYCATQQPTVFVVSKTIEEKPRREGIKKRWPSAECSDKEDTDEARRQR